MTEGYKFNIRINTNTDSVVKPMSTADAPQTHDLLPLHISHRNCRSSSFLVLLLRRVTSVWSPCLIIEHISQAVWGELCLILIGAIKKRCHLRWNTEVMSGGLQSGRKTFLTE